MKSTVPVGTGEKVRAGLDERGLEHVGYVVEPRVPRRGRRGRATSWTPTGSSSARSTPTDGDAVGDALRRRSTRRSCAADVNSAEMIKLAANAFLMTRISFINEIANVCEATGADVVKVAEGIGLDHRLGPHFLRAGIGYGGSCFPKDSLALKQLASNSGYHFQLLSAVIEVNELQKRRVVGKLKRHLGPPARQDGRAARARVQGRTPTTCARRRRSCSPRGCSPKAPRCARWDPVADGGEAARRASTSSARSLDAVRGADAAVIVTEWPELKELASAEVRDAMANPLIIDGRNLLDPETTRRAGFAYEGIGRPDVARPTCCPRRPSRVPDGLGVAWKRSSSPAARPSVSATPRAAVRRRSSRSPGSRSRPTRSPGSCAPASPA